MKTHESKYLTSDMPWLDLLLFIILGIPMLIVATLRDTLSFLIMTYRDDVKEFGFDN